MLINEILDEKRETSPTGHSSKSAKKKLLTEFFIVQQKKPGFHA
jgi:hypothetical protein